MTYDAFMFFNELDLLEIRLNILDPYVDFFVLGESTQTFSGLTKPLHYFLNDERFAKWNHKIIHYVPDEIYNVDAFQRAHHQKESLLNAFKVQDDDLIYFGDLDEIWKPQEVDDKVYKLKQLNYCYRLDNRSSEQWIGTIVGKYKNIKINGFNWNRANPSHYKEDGGWHFTNMGGTDQIIKKLEAYDHQEYNHDSIKNCIEERINSGEDYVGRNLDWQGKPFTMWQEEVYLPQYLLDNKEKYARFF